MLYEQDSSLFTIRSLPTYRIVSRRENVLVVKDIFGNQSRNLTCVSLIDEIDKIYRDFTSNYMYNLIGGRIGCSTEIIPIFTAQELYEILGSDGINVVAYEADYCRKCRYLKPVLKEVKSQISLRYSNSNYIQCIKFYSVNIGKIILPSTENKQRAKSVDSIKDIPCSECGGTGFVPCVDCNGVGYRVLQSLTTEQHSLSVTCPTCVGYKKVRCSSCGGKCYLC